MVNEAFISVSGFIATQPRRRYTRDGQLSVTMRVGWTPRRVNRATGEWEDMQSSFISVACYRKVAEHAARCLHKGEPVVLTGTMQVRDYTDAQDNKRTAVDVVAQTLGHDLSRGVSYYNRVQAVRGMTADEVERAEAAAAAAVNEVGAELKANGLSLADDDGDDQDAAELESGTMARIGAGGSALREPGPGEQSPGVQGQAEPGDVTDLDHVIAEYDEMPHSEADPDDAGPGGAVAVGSRPGEPVPGEADSAGGLSGAPVPGESGLREPTQTGAGLGAAGQADQSVAHASAPAQAGTRGQGATDAGDGLPDSDPTGAATGSAAKSRRGRRGSDAPGPEAAASSTAPEGTETPASLEDLAVPA